MSGQPQHKRGPLTPKEIKNIRVRIASGVPINQIIRIYGVASKTIRKALAE